MIQTIRVGHGYDVHRCRAGRRLVLAGVEIPAEQGLDGHSDADVALHAVIDALAGAAALPDIGEQFPDDDERYRDANSATLLSLVHQRIKKLGYTPVNVDLTIIAESPRLSPYKTQMRDHLAELLDLEPDAVSIKAKTNEGLGEIGQGLAIACHAVVLLTRPSAD